MSLPQTWLRCIRFVVDILTNVWLTLLRDPESRLRTLDQLGFNRSTFDFSLTSDADERLFLCVDLGLLRRYPRFRKRVAAARSKLLGSMVLSW